jgi:hypothetical protein
MITTPYRFKAPELAPYQENRDAPTGFFVITFSG